MRLAQAAQVLPVTPMAKWRLGFVVAGARPAASTDVMVIRWTFPSWEGQGRLSWA
jgi:hypothetical protein